jgi:hypothetical protein
VKAPQGAPNVVLILLNDVGFVATSTFGGVIATPTFDSLATFQYNSTKYNSTIKEGINIASISLYLIIN